MTIICSCQNYLFWNILYIAQFIVLTNLSSFYCLLSGDYLEYNTLSTCFISLLCTLLNTYTNSLGTMNKLKINKCLSKKLCLYNFYYSQQSSAENLENRKHKYCIKIVFCVKNTKPLHLFIPVYLVIVEVQAGVELGVGGSTGNNADLDSLPKV